MNCQNNQASKNNGNNIQLNSNHKVLGIDIETYSDIDLGKCGVYKYSESSNFEILLLAYAFDDEPVKIVDLACGEEIPSIVLEAINNPHIKKVAYNAQFERVCIGSYLGRTLDPESWECTMVQASFLTLPFSLESCAEVLKTGDQKDKAGKDLIKYFSVPCKPTKVNGGRTRNLPEHAPEKWQRFKEYCIQDVETERAIRKRIAAFPIPKKELEYYHMDQRINDRGILIDTDLVEQAIACDFIHTEAMTKKAYNITGLENPNSVTQLKGWLEARGIEIDSLSKKAVENMISELDKNSCDEETLEMLRLRLKLAKSSVKKYEAAERVVCRDGRARGLFWFNGANRSGRWSSKYIQMQNLPQNHISTLEEARDLVKLGAFDALEYVYGNTPDVLSQLLRTMLIPKEGCRFIVADFSAIEARVLSWLAGEEWRLEVFRTHGKIYEASAAAMFNVPIDSIKKGDSLRQKGKVSELACGFAGGIGALIAMGALDMGVKEDELQGLIDNWREANPKIVKFWYKVEKAAKDTIKTGETNEVGRIQFEYNSGALFIVLPSGRKLVYLKPKLQPNRFGRVGITFECVGSTNKWERQETYYGRLVENITQAVARDLLAEAMLRLEKAGYEIVGSVHDEVIAEVPEGLGSVEEMCSLMSENPPWADGLPLNADGYECVFYQKS